MEIIIEEITKALQTSFLDEKVASAKKLRSELLYNDPTEAKSIVSTLEELLVHCTSFTFITAFITQSGLLLLKECLRILKRKRIPGRIITSSYLCFTQPKALAELLDFTNITLRISENNNLHVKTYLFNKDGCHDIIIGSANLTQNALKANEEWAIKFTCTDNSALYNEFNMRFMRLWSEATPVTKDWLQKYTSQYIKLHTLRQKAACLSIDTATIKPNLMQQKVLASLKNFYQSGKIRALLISATGTGKTFLSAFACRDFNARKVLFIAHRRQILVQAQKSYKRILGSDISTGFLAGQSKDYQANYIFASISSLTKEDTLHAFSPLAFDYIIIDETHRAGAASYQRILHYFKPKFILGMTATPERTDSFDIYSLFHDNIAYEIRLQEALQDNLLCPFHYFGIAELSINNHYIDDTTSFNYLISTERVRQIIKQAAFYGYSGSRVHGLIFCRTIEEAQSLSLAFNQQGFSTAALCSTDSAEKRTSAIRKLSQKERLGGLDYIFSVDLMNEGIDIPAINQIIMLRPTKSPIIFVQQLGRGLRKYIDKEYLVVLDFIGNYTNNFMIPIALFGDHSCNKDNLRRCLDDGNTILYGASTVSFDSIAKKSIYRSIDNARFSTTSFLRKAYNDLKNKTGNIPKISDFTNFGTVSILKYIDKFGSYHAFLKKYDSDYKIKLLPAQEEILSFIEKRFASGKRIYEILLLQTLLHESTDYLNKFTKTLASRYHITLTSVEKTSIINNLTNVFTITNERAKYSHCVFLQKVNNKYTITAEFAMHLQNISFRHKINAILDFAIEEYEKLYQKSYKNTCLCLYRKYTYEEVCYLLNWPHKINPNAMAGYFYEHNTKTMPVFINYVNAEKKRVAYVNKFSGNNRINAYSKANRKLNSTDANHIYDQKENNHLYLFIRKPYTEKESREFYFLGEIHAVGNPIPAPHFNGFEIIYELETPVRSDIFKYLID